MWWGGCKGRRRGEATCCACDRTKSCLHLEVCSCQCSNAAESQQLSVAALTCHDRVSILSFSKLWTCLVCGLESIIIMLSTSGLSYPLQLPFSWEAFRGHSKHFACLLVAACSLWRLRYLLTAGESSVHAGVCVHLCHWPA